MSRYTFTTDAGSTEIDATTDDEAAVKFAASRRIDGVRGIAGLLAAIGRRDGYATITDDRGDVVGRVDPDTGTITIYPKG